MCRTSDNTMAMRSAVLTFVFATLWADLVLSQDPRQCTEHLTFDSDNRRSPEYVNSRTSSFCDISLKKGWYRLRVNNRDVDLVTTAPQRGACNTGYPVWLNGNVSQTVGQEVTLTACVVSNANCAQNFNVTVINCGEYRVYNLEPTSVCPSAYCLDVHLPCPNGTSSESGNNPGCSSNFPSVNIKPVVTPIIKQDSQDLLFECNFDSSQTNISLFDIIWRINDKEVTRLMRQPISSLPQSSQLLESQWFQRGYRLGMNVQCAIRVRASLGGIPSPEHKSKIFFAGLKALNKSVIVRENEHVLVHYQATVPITCLPGFAPCDIRFTDRILESINGFCKRNGGTSHCGFDIASDSWNQIHTFNLTAHYDGIFGDRIAEIHLMSDATQGVWAGVAPQPVVVNILDRDADLTNNTCRVFNDPHFNTFDKEDFDVHLDGEFVLYRHKVLPIEVRGFFQKCDSNQSSIPFCICGAAVRSGQQIFVWSKCEDNLIHRRIRISMYGCNRNQMKVTNPAENTFNIDLPTGTKVMVTNSSIEIQSTPADYNQTMGLCGNFNGNKGDDNLGPAGEPYECDQHLQKVYYCIYNRLGSSWRINDTSESFYDYPEVKIAQSSLAQCLCEDVSIGEVSNKSTCNNKPVDCENDQREVTDYCTELPESSRRRKKRAVDDNEGLNDDGVRAVFPIGKDPEIQLATWRNGWNETKARDHCLGFFSRSPSYDPCSKVPNLNLSTTINFCVADILLTGGSDWTLSSLETFKAQCISEVERNSTLWIAENNEKSVLDVVKETTCPNECFFNGRCENGTCVCVEGKIGADCSIDAHRPPNITRLPRDGLCDLQTRPCLRTVVYGQGFAKLDSLKCMFAEVHVNETHSVRTELPPYSTNATFRHSAEIVCSLPDGAKVGVTEMSFVVGYDVSVSNNNDTFGSARLFLPYDSDDYECRINELSAECEKKEAALKPFTEVATTAKSGTSMAFLWGSYPAWILYMIGWVIMNRSLQHGHLL